MRVYCALFGGMNSICEGIQLEIFHFIGIASIMSYVTINGQAKHL